MIINTLLWQNILGDNFLWSFIERWNFNYLLSDSESSSRAQFFSNITSLSLFCFTVVCISIYCNSWKYMFSHLQRDYFEQVQCQTSFMLQFVSISYTLSANLIPNIFRYVFAFWKEWDKFYIPRILDLHLDDFSS